MARQQLVVEIMYTQAYGLAKEPFKMTPDPAVVYMTPTHREVLVGLTYSVLTHRGFVLLSGDAGTGKTTILTRFLRSAPAARVRASVITNPTLTTAEFLELVLINFGVTDIPPSKAQRLVILNNLLTAANEKGEIPVLVVDEAHKLSLEVLEEVRLLGNFENPEKKLLQIVMAGQSELADVLNRSDLWQLKQRFAVRLVLDRLTEDETREYIRFRWQQSGGDEPPFTAAAVAAVRRTSEGIARLVNAICDNALVVAVAEGKSMVGEAEVIAAAADLDLIVATPVATATAAAVAVNGRANPATRVYEAAQMDDAAHHRAEAEAPKPAAPTVVRTMGVLERYEAEDTRSFLTRWAEKLGFTN